MAFQQYTALLRRVASNNGWSCTVLQQALCTRLVGTVGGNAQQPHNPSQVTSCREPHDTAVYTISHYFHTRVLHFPVLDVPVPSMGESITEGTVADILKQPGEALAADDIILQIETDKVTIDVRAPHDGVLTSVKVKQGDNIVVGQLIAQLDTQGTATAAQPTASTSTSTASPSLPHRQPLIQFPPRRTSQGVAISSLSPAEQQQYLQSLQPPSATASASATKPAGSSTSPAPPATPSQQPTATLTIASGPPPDRRTLTEREMEMIMLGGAEP